MTSIQRQALTMMEAENLGCVLVKGFGWVWPTHIRNDHGRFGEENAIVAAQLVVERLSKSDEQKIAAA